MKVDLIRYNKTSGESVTAFYKRYRAFFVKNLWKTGEFIKAKIKKETLGHQLLGKGGASIFGD